MSEARKPLTISPLFYDALSGEFHPFPESQRKLHTLGRLAVATYKKGAILNRNSEGKHSTAHEVIYSPSWASPVLATVIAQENENSTRMTGLHLEDKDTHGAKRSFSIFDQQVPKDEGLHLTIISNGSIQIMRVGLDTISEDQSFIAARVNGEFFSQIKLPAAE